MISKTKFIDIQERLRHDLIAQEKAKSTPTIIPYNVVNNKFKLKRSDKVCPTCYSVRDGRFADYASNVSKPNRLCLKCGRRLYWSNIDDAHVSLQDHEFFFIWHKSVFGLEGWYPHSYWTDKLNTQ